MNMKLNKSTLKYPPAGLNETPFNGYDSEYTMVCGEIYKERNYWRITAIVALVFLGGSIFGWLYAVNLPDIAYHVIEIAPWGEAKSLGVPGKTEYSDIQRPEQSIKYYLKYFIQNIRSVSTDKFIIRDNLSVAFNYVTSTGSNILKNILNENSPFIRADNERVEVLIESILNVSKDTYQVDWYERISSPTGEKGKTEQFRGIFNLYFSEPSEKQIVNNPLGIFVDEFSIQQINTEYKLNYKKENGL